MSSVTFKQLITTAAEAGGVTKVTAEKQLTAIFDYIGEALKSGDQVVLKNFGRLFVKQKPARAARNPRTGAAVQVPARNVVKFASRGDLKGL